MEQTENIREAFTFYAFYAFVLCFFHGMWNNYVQNIDFSAALFVLLIHKIISSNESELFSFFSLFRFRVFQCFSFSFKKTFSLWGKFNLMNSCVGAFISCLCDTKCTHNFNQNVDDNNTPRTCFFCSFFN